VFAAERRQAILGMVRANGAASLRDLARTLRTSEVTVRRDLRALEAEGLIDRRRGGAVLPGGRTDEPARSRRAQHAALEKAAIADLAASLIDEGDAIVLGAGSTVHELARRISHVPDLTVVTNSLLVAQALAHSGQVEIVMTGGTLHRLSCALVGTIVEQVLTGLRVRRAFLSGTGLTAERGLSGSTMLLSAVDRTLVGAAREVVVLADHTKIGVDTMFQTVPVDCMTHLITDSAAPAVELQSLTTQGVVVHVASTGVPAASFASYAEQHRLDGHP
jgi:DeoR/GlpR family transcriptional regulator of sugar metabolism